MENPRGMSRRGFMQNASLGLSAGILAAAATQTLAATTPGKEKQSVRLPREVWVASICQDKLEADNYQDMIGRMLARMKDVVPMQPDIICLPEVFPVANLKEGRPPLSEVAEEPLGPISQPFADFARRHHCNVICPIHTRHEGRFYNAAVVIDRQGRYVGEYRKINPTDGELRKGITPGPLDPPVFKLDFGTIGVQICFDVNWHENWTRLRRKGAEIVFWPSAFAGGQMLNGLAWINKFHIVSSTRIQPSKIVDALGDDIVSTGRFGRWLCCPVNLDTAVIQGWENIRLLDKVRAKYGRKVNVKTKHAEAWAALEGRSADVSVPEILKEFGIKTSNEMLANVTKLQNERRP